MIRIRTLQNVQHLVVNMSIRSERVKHVQVVVLSTRAASATSSLLNQQTSCRHVPLYISTHHLAHRMKTQFPVARQTTRTIGTTVGREIGRTVVRGLLGGLFGKR